jgi:hypothetical protein
VEQRTVAIVAAYQAPKSEESKDAGSDARASTRATEDAA